MFKKSTGNWAEDLGQSMHDMLMIGLAAMVIVPVLLIVIVVLLVTR